MVFYLKAHFRCGSREKIPLLEDFVIWFLNGRLCDIKSVNCLF